MEADRAVEDLFSEKRQLRVTGLDKRQKVEQVDLELYVEKKAFELREDYEKGTFTNMWVYARPRGIKARGDDEPIVYLRDELELTVVRNEEGGWGVESLDHGPDSTDFAAASPTRCRKTAGRRTTTRTM